jgi:hypothetical protein
MSENKPRSVSRGRENLVCLSSPFFQFYPFLTSFQQSSGRGGLGNIRSTSRGVSGISIADGPDDFSGTRGREQPVDSTKVCLARHFLI